MKAVTITVTFAGCLDGCPYAEGADRIMCPVFCTRANRRVLGYSSRSSEIPPGATHPPWCPIHDQEVDVAAAHAGAPEGCPLPKAGGEGGR